MSSVFLVATELKRPLPRVSLITKTPLVGLPSVSPLKREGEVGRDTSKFKITSKFLSTFGLGVTTLSCCRWSGSGSGGHVEACQRNLGKGSFWIAKQQLCSHKKSGEEERERKAVSLMEVSKQAAFERKNRRSDIPLEMS